MEPLCEFCGKIPFSTAALNSLPLDERIFQLSPRIADSSCPFCCLANLLFREVKGEIPDSPRVQWTHDRVIGPIQVFDYRARPAFRLCDTASNEPEDNACIGFVAKTAEEAVMDPDCFVRPRPSVRRQEMLSLIRTWVSQCETTHLCGALKPAAGSNIAATFPGLHVLRFIDVDNACVVEVAEIVPYTALSYVWGAVPHIRLTKANRAKLLEPGCLQAAGITPLPKTIDDAITLTRLLGRRYLWVDSLCLLQNDRDDMDRGVQVMDLIYQHAWVTLIAASGHDANAGLPGVREGSQHPRAISEVLPNVRLGLTCSLNHRRSGTYFTRGWTLQEETLSRRRLYFSDDQVYFRCLKAEHAEQRYDRFKFEDYMTDQLNPCPTIRLDGFQFPVLNYYQRLVEEYSKRALTYQADGLRAVAGVTRKYSEGLRCGAVEGLLTSAFDFFLLFRGERGGLRRRPPLPSYSQAGWQGGIVFETHDSERREDRWAGWLIPDWLSKHTWIVWYKRRPMQEPELIWQLGEEDQEPPYPSGRSFMCEGVTESLGRLSTNPTSPCSVREPIPSYPLLQFWTLAVFFQPQGVDVIRQTVTIGDRHGSLCGKLWADSFEEEQQWIGGDTGVLEVILLSETGFFATSLRTEKEFAPSQGSTPPAYSSKCYYVMVLKRGDNGTDERIGIGLVMAEAVPRSLAPGPVWKEVLLA